MDSLHFIVVAIFLSLISVEIFIRLELPALLSSDQTFFFFPKRPGSNFRQINDAIQSNFFSVHRINVSATSAVYAWQLNNIFIFYILARNCWINLGGLNNCTLKLFLKSDKIVIMFKLIDECWLMDMDIQFVVWTWSRSCKGISPNSFLSMKIYKEWYYHKVIVKFLLALWKENEMSNTVRSLNILKYLHLFKLIKMDWLVLMDEKCHIEK